MSNWSDLSARTNAAMLRTFGEPIVYMPAGGLSPAISEQVVVRSPEINQSAAPGAGVVYFADIDVDPATPRARGDKVIWADGVEYVVAKVVAAPYTMTRIALHRKADPA